MWLEDSALCGEMIRNQKSESGVSWRPVFSPCWGLRRPCSGSGTVETNFLCCGVNVLLGTSGLLLILSKPLPKVEVEELGL